MNWRSLQHRPSRWRPVQLHTWALIMVLVGVVVSDPQRQPSSSAVDPLCADFPVIEKVSPMAASSTSPFRLTVASLNMAAVTNVHRVVNDLRGVKRVFHSDILFLQEVERPSFAEPGVAEELAKVLGLNYAFAPATYWGDGSMQGLAILSRFLLHDTEIIRLPQFDLRFRNRCRIAIAATVESSIGTVRLFNLHLDSRINASDRLKQLEPVLKLASQESLPTLVGGDFNTADVHWIRRIIPVPYLQRQKEAVQMAMEAQGFQTPFRSAGATYDRLGLRLDWIFVNGLEATDRGIERIAFSDHRAIWVELVPGEAFRSFPPATVDLTAGSG